MHQLNSRDQRLIKPVEWIMSSRKDLKDFPDEARNKAGNQIWMIQQGRQPDDWKIMKEIGPGAIEIRVHDPHEHRVIYVAKFPEAVYVLHCFEKKTKKTSRRDINKARQAYVEMQKIRQA